MTRDEAIRKLYEWSATKKLGSAAWAENEVDRLTVLGVLKLDEPKSAMEKLAEEMHHHGYNWPSHVWEDVNKALCLANLKIVEEDNDKE